MFSQTTGIDYSNLQKLLADQKWQDADSKTWKLMLKATKREEEGWLDDDDYKNFPREDLKIMDDLWVKYSNGKFGFTVQKQIFIECGGISGQIPSYDIWLKYGDKVGWIKGGQWLSYSDLSFSLSTGINGHLPCGGGVWVGGLVLGWCEGSFGERFGRVLFSRI